MSTKHLISEESLRSLLATYSSRLTDALLAVEVAGSRLTWESASTDPDYLRQVAVDLRMVGEAFQTGGVDVMKIAAAVDAIGRLLEQATEESGAEEVAAE